MSANLINVLVHARHSRLSQRTGIIALPFFQRQRCRELAQYDFTTLNPEFHLAVARDVEALPNRLGNRYLSAFPYFHA